jgi:hypothetical protein
VYDSAQHSSQRYAQVFSDPVAGLTEWSFFNRPTSNSDRCRLVLVNPRRAEFQTNPMRYPSRVIILLVGALVFFVGATSFFLRCGPSASNGLVAPAGFETSLMGIALTVFGLVFIAFGAISTYGLTVPVVFDLDDGAFWKGRFSKDRVPLDQVHAIQLIKWHVRGRSGSYYWAYQLNLVSHDGRRVHVIGQGNQTQLLTDAGYLSSFLGKSLWDATSSDTSP